MRRISSRMTFYYKRVLPVVWFGLLAVAAAVPAISLITAGAAAFPFVLPFFVAPALVAVAIYFFLKKFVFDLVDEAADDGDTLIVKKDGREDRIALADIKNASYTALLQPARVTLLLRKPSIFGDKVSFCAPIRFIPFLSHPI